MTAVNLLHWVRCITLLYVLQYHRWILKSIDKERCDLRGWSESESSPTPSTMAIYFFGPSERSGLKIWGKNFKKLKKVKNNSQKNYI